MVVFFTILTKSGSPGDVSSSSNGDVVSPSVILTSSIGKHILDRSGVPAILPEIVVLPEDGSEDAECRNNEPLLLSSDIASVQWFFNYG